MNRRAIKRIKIGLLFFPLLFVLSFCQNNANAEMISSDNLYKMSLLTSIRECYYNHAKNPLSFYNLGSSWENFFDKNVGDYKWDDTTSQEVWISTHVGNTLKSTHSGDTWERDSNLSCGQLFKGYSGQGEAKGLFQLFQMPEIKSTNMAAWGYRLIGSTAPSPSEEPTTNENKVKITITDIKSLDGNKNPITASGEIICNGIPGLLTSAGKGQYNWILNCEGEIDTYLQRGNEKTLIYVVKATYSDGRKWRAAAFDGFSDFDEWAPPSYDCYSDKKDECRYLSYGENTPELLRTIQSAASNVHANDWSDKSVLEILNGDAANLQEGDGALTYRLYKMTYSVFRSIYNQPSFNIKVEAVKDNSGGGGSGGTENTANYEPILNKRTAGEIFAYNLNFDESLPHSDETAVYVGNERYAYKQYVWDSTAKYSLYYKYLLNMIKLWPNDININSCSDTKPENGYYFKNSINQWCSINIAGSLTNKDLGIDIREYIVSTAEESRYQLKKGTFDQVLEWFKKETSYEGIPEGAYANGQVGDDGELDPVDPDPGGGGGSGSGDPCYTNSGSLGWIVCPVITWLGDTLNAVYEEAVEPMLQIKSELFSGKGGSKTEAAWEIFRNIANIMFVILFLMVIFSQLTGVGIDNYGIKKILPKLIVAAVLINLSYVICQLAVDISNIAGAGLNGLLSSQAGSMSGLSGNFTSGVWFKHVINAFLVLITGVGVGTVLYTAIEGGLMQLLLPLLMGLIVAFVAVIFFFALLGMRQAGVIIMVVVSPVAFACYMLPNTKKIFDKWLKIFEGLLLLYPICGLLVGGSTLASTILVSGSTDFFIWLIGLLLMVVPFFFIPTLLKGSFAALGGIGAKIAGFGKKFGKGLGKQNDKLIRSTDTFRRANNALGRHSLSRKRRAAAVSDTAAFKKEMGARRRLSDRGNMKTRIAAIEAAEDAKATDEATSQRLSLMMSSGEGGGITFDDPSAPSGKRKEAYTLDSAERRMQQLEEKARSGELTSDEKLEVSALARGMANMKGGAGKLGRIIRNSRNVNGNGANTNFMSTMGEIYARDAIVQSKMNEKDMGASVYTEHFMPGGAGVTRDSNGQLGFTQTHSSYSGTADYRGSVFGRVKSHAAGLNQGGDATTEYIESLSQEACQEIMDNQELLNSLDVDVRQQFLDYAAGRTGTIMKTDANGNQVPKWDYSSTHTGWSVTEPRAKTVQFGAGSKEMQAFGNIEASTERVAVNTERTANGIDDVNSQLQRHTRASMDAAAATLDNETLMEIATNPQAAMDDPLREAAEREAKRRVQDGKMNP